MATTGDDRTPGNDDGRSRPEDARRGLRLRTAGQLVQGGGASGSLATLLYIAVGIGFWSLVGLGADRLLGTRWIVVLGACIGAASGIYAVYVHLREALNRNSSSDGSRPRPHGPDPTPRS